MQVKDYVILKPVYSIIHDQTWSSTHGFSHIRQAIINTWTVYIVVD